METCEMFCFDHDLKIDIDLLFDFDSHSTMKSYENYDVMTLFDFDPVVDNYDHVKHVKSKEEFLKTARQLRCFAQKHFDFGTAGSFGGVDGEFSASMMYNIIYRLLTASEFTSSKRYGADLGSGSAMAIFSYFNFGAGLRMVGIEANEMRYLYSVRLQELLSRSTDFRNQLSRMSLLFHGNAADILLERLSIHPLFLWVVYWFRQGWSYNDIQAVALYLNNVPNLEWIIVDLTFEDLKNFGYVGKLRSESKSYRGRLNKSTNTRTLYMHHVSQADDYYDRCSNERSLGKEALLLKVLGTENPIDHAKLQIRQIEGKYGSRKRCKLK
jgi:hypothetical protein